MYWVLLLVGIILAGTGAGLFAAYDPAGGGGIVGGQTASSFLTHGGVRALSGNPAITVEQITQNYQSGDSVAIKDTVSAVQYNATTDTTSLTFSSIASQPSNNRGPQSTLAGGLFGTVSGSVPWLKGGTVVLMMFTVVRAQLPGGPYGSTSYLTLNAAADATFNAINNPGPSARAVAIGQQYLQPDNAPLGTATFNGLFLFMLVLGVLCLAAAVRFADRIERWVVRQTKDPKHLVVGLTGGMAILAGVFMPFYPWWIVLFFAAVVMLVAWRFPQLALLVLVLLVTPEVAYQSGALGVVFLFSAIPVLYA
ncbi:MAG TPA: hypothetical protein VGV64_06060, partial [Thermoplasmata archaeon]|nr:hypothetical protein [Thermoplasmata archaeon]